MSFLKVKAQNAHLHVSARPHTGLQQNSKIEVEANLKPGW